MRISRIRSVIAIANTPSLNASTRPALSVMLTKMLFPARFCTNTRGRLMSRAFYLVSFAVIGAGPAACGSDSNGPAPGFECLGQALPTTAPPLVNVSGTVTANVLTPGPVPHAYVYGFRTGDTTHLAGDTTDTPGRYSLAISTGGTPVNGYLAISDSGHHIDTYAYPAVPLAADVTENVLMVSSSEFSFLAAAAGITPVAGDGFIVAGVRNCQGAPIAGAMEIGRG